MYTYNAAPWSPPYDRSDSYFVVLMSSLSFYNVENSKNKEKTLEWVGVSKLLTVSIQTRCYETRN